MSSEETTGQIEVVDQPSKPKPIIKKIGTTTIQMTNVWQISTLNKTNTC